jgi:hypothetical protein
MTMNLPSIDFHIFTIIWILKKNTIKVLVHALKTPQSLK